MLVFKSFLVFRYQVKSLRAMTARVRADARAEIIAYFTIWRPFLRPFWIFSRIEKSNDFNNIIFEFLDQNYIRLVSLSNFVA